MATHQFAKLHTTKHPMIPSRQEQVTRWIGEHRRQLQIGLGGGGVVVLCLMILFFYREQQHQYGLSELSSGLSAFSEKDFPTAIAHLEHAVDVLSKDESIGQLALFYLGSIYRAQQQPEKAQLVYSKMVAGAEKSQQPYLSQLALLQLGRTAEQQRQFSEAAGWYEKAKALNGPLKSEALFAQARATEKAGNHEAALLYYKEFNESYADSPLSELAKEKGE